MSYVGNKNFSNVIHELVNRLPLSSNYYSLFYGSGGLERSVYTEDALFICSEKNPECKKKYETSTMARIDYSDYRQLLEENVFTSVDFIFADPPYKFSTRRNGRVYYKFEFEIQDHIEFLNYITSLPCRIMVTHPQCDLYDNTLKGWNRHDLNYMTHSGWFKDSIYMNYDPSSVELLNYNALGSDSTDRQRIKRQRKNVVEKFKKLDHHVRMAIARDLKKNNLI